jgi:dATP pyrophosphohydrolase
MSYKRPISVLVVIHTPDLEVLLMERALDAGYWQSVTGSQEEGETLPETAHREVAEETGIAVPIERLIDWQFSRVFEIFPQWRSRYAPGVTRNTEHVFSLELPRKRAVRLAPGEHLDFQWLPWKEAAAKCFSWTNRDAILMLPERCVR